MALPSQRAKYHLRFQLLPTPNVADHAAHLADFCHRVGAEEVVLIMNGEELFHGHLAAEADQIWFDAITVAREVLVSSGLQVSLNPWVTVGHADRGRLDQLGFTPMVSPNGETAQAQASFACPIWRQWLAEYYARYAQLGFRVMWIGDDFRFHNHAPLSWGGGFEDLMLDRLASLLGTSVSRDQLVSRILAPGRPHPWRAALQTVWRTAQLEVAELLCRTVAEHSPQPTTLGLMSSQLGVASVEGRDWPALLRSLAIHGRVAHRPHFLSYVNTSGHTMAESLWALQSQRSLRDQIEDVPEVEFVPEIENLPHTAWAKSDTQTWSDMVLAQLSACTAQFLDLHPFYSGLPNHHPRIESLLVQSKPALDFLADRFHYPDIQPHGVHVLTRLDAAAHVRTRIAATMTDLDPRPHRAATFLLGYGVPCTPSPTRVTALFDQQAWALTEHEISRLLSASLLLDGEAASILAERGFGEELGIDDIGLIARESPHAYALEVITSEGAQQSGLPTGRLLSVNQQSAIAMIHCDDAAQVWTALTAADGSVLGASRICYRNHLGGRVAIIAATEPEELPRSDDGQQLLHAMINWLDPNTDVALVSGGPHLIPHQSSDRTSRRLMIMNGNADPGFPAIATNLGRPSQCTLLAPLQSPKLVAITDTLSGLHATTTAIPHRGALLLEWRNA